MATKGNTKGGAVRKGADAKPEDKKVSSTAGSDKLFAKAKLTAPELPGSMKYMLSDDKGEDSELRAIRVTFFRQNITQMEFLTSAKRGDGDSKKEMVWLGPVEYDLHKETVRIENKEKRDAEAAISWVKKLASRCLIFVKAETDEQVMKYMNLTPVPNLVLGMMREPQKGFKATYPQDDDVLRFWTTIADGDREEVVKYAAAMNVDYRVSLSNLVKDKNLRDERKAAKAAAALSSKAESKKASAPFEVVKDWKDDDTKKEEQKKKNDEFTPFEFNAIRSYFMDSARAMRDGANEERRTKIRGTSGMVQLLGDERYYKCFNAITAQVQPDAAKASEEFIGQTEIILADVFGRFE